MSEYYIQQHYSSRGSSATLETFSDTGIGIGTTLTDSFTVRSILNNYNSPFWSKANRFTRDPQIETVVALKITEE